ncbi:MAG TPA: GNAT family N-acetyltransferase [Longimicrobiales bacterium]|nr:GNAT family N-acetyltransferase [Longimicrobiales bacterium]
MTDYEIRPFRTIEELKECVRLQEETWGAGFSERVPPAILKVSQILGGIASGAYAADGTLAGFVFGMTGIRDGELVHWSDMLAVRPEARDSGLGTRLKAYQRDEMLQRGVRKMYWTFDPLQSRNAYLNFAKLGIVVREYAKDMYGDTDSPLHRGIGTDRLIALWLMDHDRVAPRLSGEERGPAAEHAPESRAALAEADPAGDLALPGEPVLGLDAPRVRVAIPADVSAVMERSMEVALAWRAATREALSHYLDRGYEVRELLRGPRTSHYLLYRERL